MVFLIENIKENEHVEYRGDVRVEGSIGKNARVTITDGYLTVGGNIEADTRIKLCITPYFSSNGTSSFSSVFHVNNTYTLSVQGIVEDRVSIDWKYADVNVNGDIGNDCVINSLSGSITLGSIGNNSTIKTLSGHIKAGNVGANCVLKNVSGNIDSLHVEHGSSLKAVSGNVRVLSAGKSVSLNTVSGCIVEHGVAQKKNSNMTSSHTRIYDGQIGSIFSNGVIINNPNPNPPSSSGINIGAMILYGFIAAAGIALVALAFVLPALALVLAASGFVGLAAGSTGLLFESGQCNCST